MLTEPPLSGRFFKTLISRGCRRRRASCTRFWPSPFKLYFWTCYSQIALCEEPLHSQSWLVRRLDCQAFLPRPRGKESEEAASAYMRGTSEQRGLCELQRRGSGSDCGHCLARRARGPAAWPRACFGTQTATESLGQCPSCGWAWRWQPDFQLSTACGPVCFMANILCGDLTRVPGFLCTSELWSRCSRCGMIASGPLRCSLPLFSHLASSKSAAGNFFRALRLLPFMQTLSAK